MMQVIKKENAEWEVHASYKDALLIKNKRLFFYLTDIYKATSYKFVNFPSHIYIRGKIETVEFYRDPKFDRIRNHMEYFPNRINLPITHYRVMVYDDTMGRKTYELGEGF